MASISKVLLTLIISVLVACGGQPPENSPGNSPGNSSSSSSSGSGSIYPAIESGCDGYATRFWDCCKPHCGWEGNLPKNMDPLPSCGENNRRLNDINASSACSGGNAHTCYGLVPWAVSNTLAYGYAATQSGDVCGRCYQLQFTGKANDSDNEPGSAALNGKTMIVQAINIGGDVHGGQFDIMIPGGGVGIFNACSAQWGVSTQELGAQYGGLLRACKERLGWQADLSEYKSCLSNKCRSVFQSRGLNTLYEGCMFYVNWFESADNPKLKYKEIACPQEIIARSGLNRSGIGDISNSCGR